ncbi:hypothetical protein MHBO_003787 [Bonamia ostreae]|uniref:Kinetochore protein SPC25 n=1 Tax=Bonamia ostreae TaxID=126728 RepID=A0ABV2ARG2_9EUKA
MLDEVAHWNKEALKMENRVRQYEKKLMAVGVSLEYNREETKETEKQQEILINERNNLKIQCEDKDYLIRKYEKRENELMEQISDLKNKTEKNQNGKKFKNFEKLCECFTLMCGMKIEEIEKYFENESIRHFRCKSVNYKNTKMLEFEMKIDLSTNKANFEPLRLVDPANVLPDELKHKIEFDIFQLPLFLSKVLSVVNSE